MGWITMNTKPRIGTIDRDTWRVFVQTLDPDTGEHSAGWFRLEQLWDLGYDIFKPRDLVVTVRSRKW
jgi:hypothetical protein